MGTTMTLTADLATLPDPPKDRPGKPVPERIAAVLSVVAILLEYGRHLAETIEHRALWRGFATIAQFFGTATVPVMQAHIHRGILRAFVLQQMLLRRATRGRDLTILARRMPARHDAEPAAPQAEPAIAEATALPPAEAPPTEQLPPDPVRRIGPEEPLTLDTLPSMAQLEAEVRSRPVGQTVADICRDLGISPGLCESAFWDEVFMAIHRYRGNLGDMILEMRRREKQFDNEHWKHPGLALPEDSREGVRRELGFLIGEQPVDPNRPMAEAGAPAAVAAPSAPVAEAATGPP